MTPTEKSAAEDSKLEKRIENLKEKLTLIKREISRRDPLFNFEKVRIGDYILSFRRTGGGVLRAGKTVLSIKKLIDTFGYLKVNNEIIPERHRVIKESLKNFGLCDDFSCMEVTFKTDTYLIREDLCIKPIPELGINEEKTFADLTAEEKVCLINHVIYEIQARMLSYLAAIVKDENIKIDGELEYGITAGIERVKSTSVNLLVILQGDFITWRNWFWQKIAKSNSIKAAVIADLKNTTCEIFSKQEFDKIVREVRSLNTELSKDKSMMEKCDGFYTLKPAVAQRLKQVDEGSCDCVKAYTYFSKIKILEEIIDMPISIGELIKNYNRTKENVERIEKSLKILDKCISEKKSAIFNRDRIIEDLNMVDSISRNAMEQLNIDQRNPEFSSDIKFFHDSSSLKIGKYFLVLIDIKNAGLKIRKIHEKKLLEYANSGLSYPAFVSLSFHSYEEFLQEIIDNQKKVKAICQRHMGEEECEEVLYLAFGDEIFIVIPDNRQINHILSEINKKLEVNVRIVSTYFDVNEEINRLGSGKQIISAFNTLMKGDKVVKNFEKEKDDFRKIVLIDQNYSYKLIEEITESLESVEDVFVYTTMLSSGME